jgi:uncharacterized protein (TIGR03790 family)
MTTGRALRRVRLSCDRSISFTVILLIFLSRPAFSSPTPHPDPAALGTIVVYNSAYPESKTLAEYYASHRNIPADQIIALSCPIDEEIDRDDYDTSIADPLREQFAHHHWWDTITGVDLQTRVTANRIRFVALIRGIPLKIRFKASYPGDHPDPSKPWGMTNEASVDSELAILGFFTRQISGPIENPFFRSSNPITAPETDQRLLLVTRLDAPSSGEVRRMIDDSIAAEKKGLWGWTYVDARGIHDPAYQVGDDWMFHIVDQSLSFGRPVILDRFEAMFPSGYPMTRAMLYFGWYADHPIGALSDSGFRFLPGAIAVPIFSFSAASIRSAENHWVGPLIHRGVAATIGYVYEPYLSLTATLDVFHDRLLQGMTFAESAYASLLPLSWMSTCVGDPLYRPFSGSDRSSSSGTSANPFAMFQELSKRNSGKPDQLIQDLLQQGSTNPLFFEFAGVVAEHNDQNEIALRSFERARQNARNGEEKFRALIDELVLLLKLDRKPEMVSIIEKAEPDFSDPAAHDIFKFYKFQ